MDVRALYRNVRAAARTTPTIHDGLKRLLWSYAGEGGVRAFFPRSHTIAFRYPPPVGDIRLSVRSNRGSDLYILSEVFDQRFYDFDLPFEPATILDLGANIGLTAIYFARKFRGARLAVVEPIRANVEVLRENLALNQIEADVFEAAVTAADTTVAMELMPHDYGHRIAQGSSPEHVNVRGLSVPTLLDALQWERIGLLKVDIEGYESILFRGEVPWLWRVDAICIEWHEDGTRGLLDEISARYGFSAPQLLSGTILLVRNRASSA